MSLMFTDRVKNEALKIISVSDIVQQIIIRSMSESVNSANTANVHNNSEFEREYTTLVDTKRMLKRKLHYLNKKNTLFHDSYRNGNDIIYVKSRLDRVDEQIEQLFLKYCPVGITKQDIKNATSQFKTGLHKSSDSKLARTRKVYDGTYEWHVMPVSSGRKVFYRIDSKTGNIITRMAEKSS